MEGSAKYRRGVYKPVIYLFSKEIWKILYFFQSKLNETFLRITLLHLLLMIR